MAGRPEVFDGLKAALTPLAGRLLVTADTATTYALDIPGYRYRDKPSMPFASVRDGKSYVSLHLFPVYVFPDLLAELSAPLRRRMQGRSCFNFKVLEPELVSELAAFAERAEVRFRTELQAGHRWGERAR